MTFSDSPITVPEEPIIELRHLKKRFGRLVVLDDVSLKIEAGRTIVILGPSGTGKSVLLKHIVGLLRPDAGGVFFEGRCLDRLSQRDLAEVRQQFGFLFQMGALFDSMDNLDNVAFPITEHTNKPPEETREIARHMLKLVGLPDIGQKLPAQLSGGQRKRVALARAIALRPKVILYDEPTTGLDPIRSDVINELIIKLQRELQVTSVVVTHDMQSAFKVADRIVMLFDGKLRFDGTPDEIRACKEPIVQQFIRGEASEAELAQLDAK